MRRSGAAGFMGPLRVERDFRPTLPFVKSALSVVRAPSGAANHEGKVFFDRITGLTGINAILIESEESIIRHRFTPVKTDISLKESVYARGIRPHANGPPVGG